MEDLCKKEFELIKEPILILIEKFLLEDFKNRSGQKIIKVKGLILPHLVVDTDTSEFKSEINVIKIKCDAKVEVRFHESSRKNDNLNLSSSKITLIYNHDLKKYVIENSEEVKIFDVSF